MGTQTLEDITKQAERDYRSGRYGDAALGFAAASGHYTAAGNALSAAEMANNKSVALLKSGDAQGAFQAADGTDLVFATAGDQRRQAMALGNQAAALEGLGKLDEARSRYEACISLLHETGDNDLRQAALQSLSGLQVRSNHQLEALASMHSALALKKKLSPQESVLKRLLDTVFRMLKG